MGRRVSWGLVCAVLVFGCKRRHEPVVHQPACLDEDGDEYGVGGGCRGFDCAEGDPNSHECDCSGDGIRLGCPCDSADPLVCYDGPSERLGFGLCAPGLRTCSEHFWSACEGQILPADEVCNEQDDDCDGEVDEDVDNECSDCTSGCALLGFGAGRAPFVADGTGLALTADGALTLTGESMGLRLAWIPNTLEGTISKVDTRTHEQVGRYRTGPRGPSTDYDAGEGDVPAAVAVTPAGDGIVANRAPRWSPSVTRIRSEDCPPGDDGVVDTSSGDDVLAWGAEGPTDDCVAWNAEVGTGMSVGRAVVLEIRTELDGLDAEIVWLAAGRRLIELDGETGETTGRSAEIDRAPSSAVIDAEGWIWLAEPGGRDLLRVDTFSLDS